MYQVNRSIVILKPKQPFLDWLLNIETYRQVGLTLQDLRHDCTTLLLPNVEDEEGALQYVYSQYTTIFEMELEAWIIDETLWPDSRNLKMFKDWIELEFHTTVIDLVEDEFEITTSTALH